MNLSLRVLCPAIGLAASVAAHAQIVPVNWVTQFGSAHQDHISSRIVSDSAGNVIVAGTYASGGNSAILGTNHFGVTNLPPNGGADIYLAKFNPSGSLLWAVSAGGNTTDEAAGVVLDQDGSILLAGSIRRTSYFGTNIVQPVNDSRDFFLARYSGDGVLQWVRNYGGAFTESARGIAVDNLGAIYVAGTFLGTTTSIGGIVLTNFGDSTDIFLAKFNSTGDVVWARHASGPRNQDGQDEITGIGTDDSGHVYIAGQSQSSRLLFSPFTLTNSGGALSFLAKFDTDGQVVWAKRIFSAFGTGVSALAIDREGSAYLGGTIGSDTVFLDSFRLTNGYVGTTEAFVAKVDLHGVTLWASSGGGTNTDAIASVAVDSSGNSYFAGGYVGSWSFGGRTLPALSHIAGRYSACFFKVNSQGEMEWAYGAGAEADAFGLATGIDAGGHTYFAGTFERNISFGSTNLTGYTMASDVFLFRGPRPPPRISAQPQSRNVSLGDTVTFSVSADGEPPLRYQWLFNGTEIPGATNSSLVLTNSSHDQAGIYSVIVSNDWGEAFSETAQLLFNFLTLRMYAGITIDGQIGQTYEIQYMENPSGPTGWQTLTNLTLPASPFLFIDVQSPNHSKRFYRVVPAP